MTHTYAILKVSPACFAEIHAKLKEAGYEDQFEEDEFGVLIDMHGIAIQTDAS
jgi:hypothetical protein